MCKLYDYLTNLYGVKCVTFLSFLYFLSDNEFGEVKPTPVLKSNHQGELAFVAEKATLNCLE